jgi:hypothetical protein
MSDNPERIAYVSDGAYCADCATDGNYESILVADGYPDGFTCADCGAKVK